MVPYLKTRLQNLSRTLEDEVKMHEPTYYQKKKKKFFHIARLCVKLLIKIFKVILQLNYTMGNEYFFLVELPEIFILFSGH